MDVEAAEFQGWEMLPSNRASDFEPLTPDGSAGNTNGVNEVGSETIGVIQPNYFSLDSQIRYMSTFTGADGSEEESEKSDNPSWIDPGSENNELTMNTCREFWSDSGSEIEGKNELSFEEMKSENGEECWPNSVKFGAGQNSHLQEVSVEENQENGNVEGEHNGNVEGERRDAGDQKKSLVWWWKVPIQLVKYCAAFRVSPVWTFSVAAAMAFVILGRRLYKMKKKTKPLELKVTVDHNNVSQFTSRAARLNEAFSIVKRVPVIRPQLPAAGDTLWPITHMEMIKGFQGPTMMNLWILSSRTLHMKAYERELTEFLTEASECYHYLFDAAIKIHQLGIDWTTPTHTPIQNANISALAPNGSIKPCT